MSAYTRDPLNFKEQLAHRRDELVLANLTECTPALAITMLESARAHLHSHDYTTGSLDAIVILFHTQTALKLAREGL